MRWSLAQKYPPSGGYFCLLYTVLLYQENGAAFTVTVVCEVPSV
jgi:hypothetical protein